MEKSFNLVKVLPACTGDAIYWLHFERWRFYLCIDCLIARSYIHIIRSQPKTTQPSAGKATCEILYHVLARLFYLSLIFILHFIRRKRLRRISLLDYLNRNIWSRGRPTRIFGEICNISYEKWCLIYRNRWGNYLIGNIRWLYSGRQANWWLAIFI